MRNLSNDYTNQLKHEKQIMMIQCSLQLYFNFQWYLEYNLPHYVYSLYDSNILDLALSAQNYLHLSEPAHDIHRFPPPTVNEY